MKNKIRPIAIGLFIHNNRLLVSEGYDEIKGKAFFRPLGGAIKFGETGSDAIKREIKEEISEDIEVISFQGVIENLLSIMANRVTKLSWFMQANLKMMIFTPK